MRIILPVVLSLICLSTAALAEEHQVVEIEVSGLACPFCVYGVEKSLKKLQGVDSVQVDLAKGRIQVEMQPEQAVDLDQLRHAIVNAGFTPGEATTSVVDR